MNSRFLNNIPTSGQYEEKHFGSNFNNSLWVKFSSNNNDDWVDCFSRGEKKFDKLLVDSNNKSALVIAGGQGFVIDIDKQELIKSDLDLSYIESAIKTNIPECYIVSSFYEITIITTLDLHKTIRPDFTVDGIYLLEQIDKKVLGHLYLPSQDSENNVGFELDIMTLELELDFTKKYRLTYKHGYELID